MLRHTTFLIAVAISSLSVAADESRPLADAIKAIHEQAAKLPECRAQSPLTEDEVVKCIETFRRPNPAPGDLYLHLKTLSDEEFQKLTAVAETRRLPKEIILRQFVRYNDGTGVEHGWWVRLILMRRTNAPSLCRSARKLCSADHIPKRNVSSKTRCIELVAFLRWAG